MSGLTAEQARRLNALWNWARHFRIGGPGVKVTNTEQNFSAYIDPPQKTPPQPKPQRGIFVVNLAQTSGSAGSSTAAPSWLYTVTDDNGNSLATNASPARGRDYNGKRNAASKGYAHYDTSGNFILDEAWESPTTFACSS